MSQIVPDVLAETSLAPKLPLAEAGETLLMAALAKFFGLERLSCRAAAQVAGVPHVVSPSRLADYGVNTLVECWSTGAQSWCRER